MSNLCMNIYAIPLLHETISPDMVLLNNDKYHFSYLRTTCLHYDYMVCLWDVNGMLMGYLWDVEIKNCYCSMLWCICFL